MFRRRRIAHLFEPLGFFVSFEAETEIDLVRPNPGAGVFERIGLYGGKHRDGKWGDISCGSIGIGLTPGRFTCIKGLAEVDFLSDWTQTKTVQEADAWERDIVASASGRLDQLVRNKVDELLNRSESARRAVQHYLEFIPSGSIQQAIETLTAAANEEQHQEAKRLSRTEGFICLPERDCYDLASILIATHACHIDGESVFWGQSPNKDREFNWRFQLLASQLYPEKGWESMSVPSP